MMKLMAVATLVALACSPSTSAQDSSTWEHDAASARSLRVRIQPAFAMNFGHTKYLMDQLATFGSSLIGRARSELVFPLDELLVGLRLGISPHTRSPKWSLEAAFFTNINDPSKSMTDGDWASIPGYFNEKFSSTESDVIGNSWHIEARGYMSMFGGSPLRVDGVLGFTYFHVKQDIVGLRGWQLDSNLTRQYFPDSEYYRIVRGIMYKASYYLPQVGLRANLSATQRLSLELGATGSVAIARDFDDHLLRYKNATGSGTGIGLLSSFKSTYEIPYGTATYLVGVSFDFLTVKVNGSQTQRWYGDDPASEGHDDTGDVLKNIHHDMSTTQYRAALTLGVLF